MEGRGRKKCELGLEERERENQNFGEGISLFRGLSWEIEVFEVWKLLLLQICEAAGRLEAAATRSKIWKADLVWRESLAHV